MNYTIHISNLNYINSSSFINDLEKSNLLYNQWNYNNNTLSANIEILGNYDFNQIVSILQSCLLSKEGSNIKIELFNFPSKTRRSPSPKRRRSSRRIN